MNIVYVYNGKSHFLQLDKICTNCPVCKTYIDAWPSLEPGQPNKKTCIACDLEFEAVNEYTDQSRLLRELVEKSADAASVVQTIADFNGVGTETVVEIIRYEVERHKT
ncbi:MAG: hypothetical protein GY861_20905 [bacterium]|nr:hypothetical protein [bacterium]